MCIILFFTNNLGSSRVSLLRLCDSSISEAVPLNLLHARPQSGFSHRTELTVKTCVI